MWLATDAFTVIKLSECATMSCSSRAMRSRSSLTACRASWFADIATYPRRARTARATAHGAVSSSAAPSTQPTPSQDGKQVRAGERAGGGMIEGAEKEPGEQRDRRRRVDGDQLPAPQSARDHTWLSPHDTDVIRPARPARPTEGCPTPVGSRRQQSG